MYLGLFGDSRQKNGRTVPQLRVSAEAFLAHPLQLQLCYELSGDLAAVQLPAGSGARCHKLWQNTCFEAFFGLTGASAYWELNVSPGGDWNLYRFSAYRTGMEEEPALTGIGFQRENLKDLLRLNVTVDLTEVIPEGASLELGLAAVVVRHTSEVDYFALKHPGTKPDFHDRNGFLVRLPA